jgi:GDP-L-fucose synthase
MVGSAIARRLASEDCEIVTVSHREVDLTRQTEVEQWMTAAKPQAIFLAAAKVGGINANNTYAAEFLYENIAIEANVIHAAYRNNVEKLLFLGSSCIYPREAPQPIPESALLTGPLEETNQWYAVAKIAGVKLCQAYRRQYGCDFISAMPTNLFGPGDNFHPENSHVPAALLRRFHEAKANGARQVTVWGSGNPRREFLHVDDLADGCVFLMKTYSDDDLVNIGTGTDVTIRTFAETIAKVVGYSGELVYDRSRPDGTPQKLMDVSKMTGLGWTARTALEDGLGRYYQWFLDSGQHDLRQ